MSEKKEPYIKRTQKDYPMSLKLQIVEAIELGHTSIAAARRTYGIQGKRTITVWLQKYGNFDWENKVTTMQKKTPEQCLLELEQEIALLKKKNARLEHESERADKKAIIFDMMIDLAEKEYKINIRKNAYPK